MRAKLTVAILMLFLISQGCGDGDDTANEQGSLLVTLAWDASSRRILLNNYGNAAARLALYPGPVPPVVYRAFHPDLLTPGVPV